MKLNLPITTDDTKLSKHRQTDEFGTIWSKDKDRILLIFS